MLIDVENVTGFVSMAKQINTAFNGFYGISILIMLFIISFSISSQRYGIKRGLIISLFISEILGIFFKIFEIISWHWLIVITLLLAAAVAFVKTGGE